MEREALRETHEPGLRHAVRRGVLARTFGTAARGDDEVVLRRRLSIVLSLVKPGESRSFRLPFDDLPGSWNNQMPQLVIAGIEFS